MAFYYDTVRGDFMKSISLTASAIFVAAALPLFAGSDGVDMPLSCEACAETGFSYTGIAIAAAGLSSSSGTAQYIAVAQADLAYSFALGGANAALGALVQGVFRSSGGGSGEARIMPYASYERGDYRLTLGYGDDAWRNIVPRYLHGNGVNNSLRWVNKPLVRADFSRADISASLSYDHDGWATFAVSKTFGRSKIYGAYAVATQGGTMSYTMGIRREFSDKLSMELAVFHPHGTRNLIVDARYRVNDRLTLSGMLRHETISWVLQSQGAAVGVQYELRPNSFIYAEYDYRLPVSGSHSTFAEIGIKHEF